jgi:hypothetical protein
MSTFTSSTIVETIKSIQQTWTLLFPESPVPDQRQCAIWLTLHSERTVREALGKLAVKQQNGTAPSTNLDRFALSVMQRIDQQREQSSTVHSKSASAQLVTAADDDRGNRL